ncbi:MAG: protein kinase [Holophagales bacterium]|nr:protein kinase [Holophagales bacterium]
MGIVYRAVDERDGKTVALKVIRETEVAGDESAPHVAEARVRFTREAEILQGLLHANIVTFYEIGEEDGTPFLAMEYLEGRPIGSYAGRPFPETLPLLIQAANGMEYLASRGIVHRDLSPDNVFVVESGGERTVKLLDFGIAKLFESTSSESLTATGFFLGKVAYGSPEQLGSLGQGAALDWRSDVYSLGVIFYQVLAGRRPFEGRAPVEYIAAHLNTLPSPVAAPPESPALPMELVRLIGQMLEKRREDRPQSYRDITERLVSVLRGGAAAGDAATRPSRETGAEGVSAGASRGPTSPTQLVAGRPPSFSPPARRTAALVLATASLLGLLFWGALTRTPGKDAPPGQVAAAPRRVPATAQLRITSVPWAVVVSVVDVKSGIAVPLPPISETPLVLPVPPGRYRVTLAEPPPGSARAEREVDAVAGEPALVALPLRPIEELVETLR